MLSGELEKCKLYRGRDLGMIFKISNVLPELRRITGESTLSVTYVRTIIYMGLPLSFSPEPGDI